MNLQCFSKLFSNCKLFRLIQEKQLNSKIAVAVVRTEEEHGEVLSSGDCQNGVCSLSNWRPEKSA